MNTASLELCKKLHKLSGWDDSYLRWAEFKEPRVVNADEWEKNMSGSLICEKCSKSIPIKVKIEEATS